LTLSSFNIICHIANYYQEFSNYFPKIDFNELENKSTEELAMFLTHLQYLVNIKNQPSVSGESVYNMINIAEVLLNIYFPELKLNGIGKYLRNEKTDKLIKEYMLFTKQISFVHPIEKLLTSIIQETYGYIAMGGHPPNIPP